MIEIEQIRLAICILAKAIEDGRIEGILKDVQDILQCEFKSNLDNK
jgi:hypothetical protein